MTRAKPETVTRFVLYHFEWGIFLGECLGMGFWSLLDPVGQPAACTWATEADALAWCQKHADHSAQAQVRPVAVPVREVQDNGAAYASVAVCVAAGLPGWDPNWSPEALPQEAAS